MNRWFRALWKSEAVELAGFTPATASVNVVGRGGVRAFHRLTNANRVIAAIGDIHGRIDLLRGLEPALDALTEEGRAEILEIYLGDYVDHAGDSRAILNFLIERQGRTDRKVLCLAGNHEQMLLKALDEPGYFPIWLRFGGEATIRSYGVVGLGAFRDLADAHALFVAAFPQAHRDFLSSLPKNFQSDGFYFVHAGVNPTKPLADQSETDLLWIREPFLSTNVDFGKVVVHGHTPLKAADVRRNRIGLDTGAYLTGRLTCLVLTSEGLKIVETPQGGATHLP